MSWWEQVAFQWNDDDVRFVLDQHTYLLNFPRASSLKQQSSDRHVALLGHIILIQSQQSLCSCSIIHFSDAKLLFGQWIIFKNLQFILLFLRIWTLIFYHFRLKTGYKYFGTCGYQTPAGLFKVCFEFLNFLLTTRLRWSYYNTI